MADPEQAKLFTTREFQKLLEEIKTECENLAKLKTIFVVKPYNSTVGAEVGSVFLEALNEEEAINLLEGMVGRFYNGRQVYMVCLPENTYLNHFSPLNYQ